jgi:hypothetical protein
MIFRVVSRISYIVMDVPNGLPLYRIEIVEIVLLDLRRISWDNSNVKG